MLVFRQREFIPGVLSNIFLKSILKNVYNTNSKYIIVRNLAQHNLDVSASTQNAQNDSADVISSGDEKRAR